MSYNLLVIFGDEMRGQAMGCAGDPNVRTPHMDRLAREGCRFTRAYANTPVCTPARGTILTGLYPLQHGAIVNDLPIRTDVRSIAHELKSGGYRCGYVGKWHLAGIPRYKFIPPGPERLGFDDYWAVWNCHHDYMDPKYFLDDPEPVFAEGYEPTVQTDLALGFMDDHTAHHAGRPFCLFLSWGPPHSPYVPWPPGMEGSYDPAKLALPPNCPDTECNRRDLAGYYAHITALDAELGRILAYLDAHGLRQNTLVVFLSDHGSMLGSQGHYHKQQPWAESVMVPLIMRAPGIVPKGAESNLLIGLLDLAPTLLGLLTRPIPTRMQGRDLSPQIAWGGRTPNRVLYLADQVTVDQANLQGIKPWRGVKTSRYTYARNVDGPWLLFDDEQDPHQMRNLLDEPRMADVCADLEEELARQMDRFGDRLLDKEDAIREWGIAEAYRVRTEHLYAGTNMGGGWPGRPPRR